MGLHSPPRDDNPRDNKGQPAVGPELKPLPLLRDVLDAAEPELDQLRSTLGGLFARELAQALDDVGCGNG